jgi:hypothetical protein
MNLAPYFRPQFLDSTGSPLAGGKIYSYQAGTTTPQATYTDADGGTPNANPVILDANGEAIVWLDPSLSYKLVLKDSNDVTLRTVDEVTWSGSIATVALLDGVLSADATGRAKMADGFNTREKMATGSESPLAVTSKTTTYTATIDDNVILCSGSAFTVTLPAAASCSGKKLLIKKTDSTFSNIITIDGNASETIDGATTKKLNTQYESLLIVSDGTNWQILQRRIPSEWTSYTPTGTWVANTTYSGYWRRVGDTIEVTAKAALTGAPTATSFRVTIPSGLTIDTAKMEQTSDKEVGISEFISAGNSYNGLVVYSNTTGVNVYTVLDSAASNHRSQIVQDTVPGTFTNADRVHVRFSVPITNWEG